MRTLNRYATISAALLLLGIADAQENSLEIDQRSYNLGILGGFSEVVRLGVKKLALSEVMTPAEMDEIMDDALVIGARNRVEMWRETDFLVTDLYPADVAAGKHVLLIYVGNTLNEYLAIKEDKAALVARGSYVGTAREEIARRFGRLLSYPEAVINRLLTQEKLLE